jgi:hypothetical protein
MTILSLDPAACYLLGRESNPSKDGGGFSCHSADRPVPRINLRKRPSPATQYASDFAIPQVTSAFLSSLFYEVNNDSKRPSEDEYVPEHRQPSKKACMTPSKSYKSFGANLASLGRQSVSPVTTNTPFFDQENRATNKDVHRVNHCVSSSSQDLAMNVAGLIFPGLSYCASTASDASCSPTITTLNFEADQQPSVTENNSSTAYTAAAEDDKETYGWFVVVDDDEDLLDKPVVEPVAAAPKDLAFRAPLPTIPTPTVHDDVKWAQAADTVDDVLADFF